MVKVDKQIANLKDTNVDSEDQFELEGFSPKIEEALNVVKDAVIENYVKRN